MVKDKLRMLFYKLRPDTPCLVVPLETPNPDSYQVSLWQPEQTITSAIEAERSAGTIMDSSTLSPGLRATDEV